MKEAWQTWRHLGARRNVAVIMLIMGLGRLGLYGSRPLADRLTPEVYGLLLVSGALLLAVTYRARYTIPGRLGAGLGAALLISLAVDAAVTGTGGHIDVAVGVTALIELWLGYILVEEAIA